MKSGVLFGVFLTMSLGLAAAWSSEQYRPVLFVVAGACGICQIK